LIFILAPSFLFKLFIMDLGFVTTSSYLIIVVAFFNPFGWILLAIMLTALSLWFVYALPVVEVYYEAIASCFDENTIIKTKDGDKHIKEICVGDILDDDSKVTATFKMSSAGEKIYRFHNTIVSGSHSILTNKGLVKICDHPDLTHFRGAVGISSRIQKILPPAVSRSCCSPPPGHSPSGRFAHEPLLAVPDASGCRRERNRGHPSRGSGPAVPAPGGSRRPLPPGES
jgi:hypothetical protein